MKCRSNNSAESAAEESDCGEIPETKSRTSRMMLHPRAEARDVQDEPSRPGDGMWLA